MTAGTPSKTAAAKAGAKGATKVAAKPTARQAAKPAAKATWFVGKKVAKRKAMQYARRYGDAGRTAWSVGLNGTEALAAAVDVVAGLTVNECPLSDEPAKSGVPS